MWQPSESYPDPRVQSLHGSFDKYRLTGAAVELLASGTRWGEGPVWFGDGRFLLWSDVPNDRIMKWEESTGSVSVFRQGGNMANGNTRDRQGRLITCEHLSRRVTRTEYDGSLTVLADAFDGKPLNSPNDVIVKSDGSIWFTDPPFGLHDFYQGQVAQQELPANLYRIDAGDGSIAVAAGDIEYPNGLCFSPDESKLYVVASRARPNRVIYVFDVSGGRGLINKQVLIDCGPGAPDGIRCDEDGNLWCGWGMGAEQLDGVRIFNRAGVPVGHIRLPERCANLCFGGRHKNRLFMAGGQNLYSLFVNTKGAA
ncbi:SMP-30/gluconolactonase/LRE family protein [Eoetvoesiella caeni]|uniref:Gluconolactonase n=1 Tax=Eoetvoesiella caeni TaxID=645616 RepID=A0A366HJ08_9BURK|nr:SMP-30/gluconolactonase/LRE family protein [Eoetvoesiella caeni]MCI2807652.1 SMP-30/gluconolactonase/LRE family protein [Eoetvoesiella caeni]NYT52953.1 SMP-30/gluconolactonase/LRE family protein [Eoetvoesiella caeni]RBP42930.1 gluconolactonase [Eoetvoesiella caeni]